MDLITFKIWFLQIGFLVLIGCVLVGVYHLGRNTIEMTDWFRRQSIQRKMQLGPQAGMFAVLFFVVYLLFVYSII